MIKYENHCCDCAVPGYPCLGNSCPYIDVPVYYCDICNKDIYAEYEVDGEHYCEDCAKAFLEEIFNDLTMLERAKLLNVDIKRLDG